MAVAFNFYSYYINKKVWSFPVCIQSGSWHWNSAYMATNPSSSPDTRLSSQGKLLAQFPKTLSSSRRLNFCPHCRLLSAPNSSPIAPFTHARCSAPINPPLMSSIAALFRCTLTSLFSPLHSSQCLSPGTAHQANALPCRSVSGLLQPLLPAGLPSKLLLKCRKLSPELVHKVSWSWLSSSFRSKPSSRCTRRHSSTVTVGRLWGTKGAFFNREEKKHSLSPSSLVLHTYTLLFCSDVSSFPTVWMSSG